MTTVVAASAALRPFSRQGGRIGTSDSSAGVNRFRNMHYKMLQSTRYNDENSWTYMYMYDNYD